MGNSLDDKTIFLIEEEARIVQQDLKIKLEPNIYEYDSVKQLFENNGVRFEFNVHLTNTSNSMQGSWYNTLKYTVLPYNVLKTNDGKIFQFSIDEPSDTMDKIEYVKFLRTVFWEYWDQLKNTTDCKNIEYLYKIDYSLFSRAMIIPYEQFSTLAFGSSDEISGRSLNDIAEYFSVNYNLICSRFDDFE